MGSPLVAPKQKGSGAAKEIAVQGNRRINIFPMRKIRNAIGADTQHTDPFAFQSGPMDYTIQQEIWTSRTVQQRIL